MGPGEEGGQGGAEMTHDVPQPPGDEDISWPLSLLHCTALESLPQPSACQQAHLMGPPAVPKCCFLMLLLNFSEPRFLK